MEPVVVEGFEIEIDPSEVRRLVGRTGARGAKMRSDDPRIERAIAEALEATRPLVDPRGVYVFAAGGELRGSKTFAHLGRMAFSVATIGPRLEEEAARLMDRGELLRAVMLDAAGSAAAEAAADGVERAIATAAAREGLKISCRASPGYGDWDVSEQRSLVELAGAARIGVRLSEGCMMIPRKSVSFAVHVAREPERLRSENSCENCGRADCEYRRDEREALREKED